MKKVKNSNAISGGGIYERGGTLADSERSYNCRRSFGRYFVDVSDKVKTNYPYGDDAASDNYDEKMGSATTYGVYF